MSISFLLNCASPHTLSPSSPHLSFLSPLLQLSLFLSLAPLLSLLSSPFSLPLQVFNYSAMTEVQAQAIPVCLSGVDVLAKAKTGTGKTLGFLLPALDRALRNPPPQGQIAILIISPTRELAMQTETEARQLLHFMPERRVLSVLGGTNQNAERRELRDRTPFVLVATPGRLNDHLENSGLNRQMTSLKVG